MPVATSFLYPKLFSPATHCIESKTTSQLDGLYLCRYEDTLENIMKIWWSLYTIDISVTFGSKANQNQTSDYFRLAEGGSVFDISTKPEATPKSRICTLFNSTYGRGITAINPYSTPFADGGTGSGNDTWFVFTFKKVYYNTDTSKYALVFELRFTDGPAGTVFYGSNSGAVANGGSVTIFGSTTYAGTHPSGSAYPDVTLVISNPTYYTY